MFRGCLQDGIEQRNQRGDTFERKSLRTEIARLQYLLEEVGANQALENFALVYVLGWCFEEVDDPAPAFRLGQMHKVRANRAAIDASRFFGGFAG